MTSIQWTDQTWNPVVGCTPVSPGCLNCYAAAQAPRLGRMGQTQYVGLTTNYAVERRADSPTRAMFNGRVELVGDQLHKPLGRKKPTRYFIASMGDLFHEAVPFEFIDRVFAVMALCPQHTFQVLTKRPERMAEYLGGDWAFRVGKMLVDVGPDPFREMIALMKVSYQACGDAMRRAKAGPLPNVWVGTSAEDQTRLEERVPHLLKCPAAVRFLSCEPLLGPLEFGQMVKGTTRVHMCMDVRGAIRNKSFDGFQHPDGKAMTRREAEDALFELHSTGVKVIPLGSCDDFDDQTGCRGHRSPRIDWVIVGGESGTQARRCDTRWIQGVVSQCKAAGIPVFVKQLGTDCCFVAMKDPKGGDPDEWPEDLRVREMPEVKR